jgi:glycosyltransferase involved in cell wall biosynthesis
LRYCFANLTIINRFENGRTGEILQKGLFISSIDLDFSTDLTRIGEGVQAGVSTDREIADGGLVNNGKVELSLILPVYNGEAFIDKNLASLKVILDEHGLDYEIVVVSDGSKDQTLQKMQTVNGDRIKHIHYHDNRGKGYAIRHGFSHSEGKLVGFIDSDFDIYPKSIIRAYETITSENADVVVGSKLHPESEVYYPLYRRFFSSCYRQLNRILFDLKIRDTQVGMKVYRREVLEKVVPLAQKNRFAFDIEMLALAEHYGYDKILECPIKLDFNLYKGSHINWKQIAIILMDTFSIYLGLKFKKKDYGKS